MTTEHEELLAAYFAWERATDACYRRLADRSTGVPLASKDEPDLRHLQRLYRAWLEKLEPLLSVPETPPVPSTRGH